MNANLKTDHAHRIEHDFIELKNYNFSSQQVVFSNHLIEQLHQNKLSNKSMQVLSLLNTISRLTGFGLFMSKSFASIECFKQIHAIKDQLAVKNLKVAIQELDELKVDVFHYINIDGRKRNKKIKQTVKLFNTLSLENSDHGKGVIYEFNHIATQFIDNRLGKDEYFKLYAKKHLISNDKYDFYSALLADNLHKLCSLDYGFSVSEVNHLTNLKPDDLIHEFNNSELINQRFKAVDSNAIHSSSSQYKYFSKVMLGSIQCFECLHTHHLQSYVLSKLSIAKDRYVDTTGKKYFVGIVTALELREALGFERPKYDDNYELTLAINKLTDDLNKFSEHTVSIKKLNKAGNRGVLAEFELSITQKAPDELKIVQENFKHKNKKGNKISSEFLLLRNFTFKNLFKVTNEGKVKILSKSLFVQSIVKGEDKAKPNNLFSANNDKYSQAHIDPKEEAKSKLRELKASSVINGDENKVNLQKLVNAFDCTKSDSAILLKSKIDKKIKKRTISAYGNEQTLTSEKNLLPNNSFDFELSLEDVKSFKRSHKIWALRSNKPYSLTLTAWFADGNFSSQVIVT